MIVTFGPARDTTLNCNGPKRPRTKPPAPACFRSATAIGYPAFFPLTLATESVGTEQLLNDAAGTSSGCERVNRMENDLASEYAQRSTLLLVGMQSVDTILNEDSPNG